MNCKQDYKQKIAWYVDDMKISHVDKDVVTQVIQDLEKKFGCRHKFLGMNLHFKNDCTSIDESGLNIMHEAAMPAKGILFDVDSESPLLEGEEFDEFRSIVAKRGN